MLGKLVLNKKYIVKIKSRYWDLINIDIGLKLKSKENYNSAINKRIILNQSVAIKIVQAIIIVKEKVKKVALVAKNATRNIFF